LFFKAADGFAEHLLVLLVLCLASCGQQGQGEKEDVFFHGFRFFLAKLSLRRAYGKRHVFLSGNLGLGRQHGGCRFSFFPALLFRTKISGYSVEKFGIRQQAQGPPLPKLILLGGQPKAPRYGAHDFMAQNLF
jgi:hypothetical protein